MRAFLGRAYNVKTIADYETDPAESVTRLQATEALANANLFVAALAQSLDQELR